MPIRSMGMKVPPHVRVEILQIDADICVIRDQNARLDLSIASDLAEFDRNLVDIQILTALRQELLNSRPKLTLIVNNAPRKQK